MTSAPSRLLRTRVAALTLGLVVAGGTTGLAGAAAADDTDSPATSSQTTPPATPAVPALVAADTPSPDPTPDPAPAPAPPTTPAPAPAPAPPGGCALTAPRNATPADATYFNYPFSGAGNRDNIRSMALAAIESVPGCELNAAQNAYVRNTIHIAAFSVGDAVTVDALIAAARRGVNVQVVTDSHNVRGPKEKQSPSFQRLVRVLATNPAGSGSFAKVCSGSCRGSGGNHHFKMYLFSHTGAKHDVVMAGSANLTIKASEGQWNHLDVYSDPAAFAAYSQIFSEVVADRPAPGPYRNVLTDAVRTWFFPRPGTGAGNDPLMVGSDSLSAISCTGSGVGNGRTIVRIGMYAWYQTRGLWLAKKVRSLWNAGCDVAVEYAVIGNNVKRILYSPAGRGRIPMRQVATYLKDGTVDDYDHQKYVTVLGRVNGVPGSTITWAGSTNWSNLGLFSDDLTQVWRDGGRAAAYRDAFTRVWRGPKTRVPSPTSKIKGKLALGSGKYRNLDNN